MKDEEKNKKKRPVAGGKKMFNREKGAQAPDYEYFVFFDSKVGRYGEPALAINRHDLLRQIDGMMRDPQQKKNQLVANAEDFSLFKIGEYSKKTGVITPCNPEHIANLHDIRSAAWRTIEKQPEVEVGPRALEAT